MNIREIECRFLNIDKENLIQKLVALRAVDHGETLLEETIFYNTDLSWQKEGKLVRIRKSGDKIKIAYKHHKNSAVDGANEIEFGIDDYQKAQIFLKKIGLVAKREQQKKRHTFKLKGVIIDIDTWPRVPTYVEFEGNTEDELKNIVSLVGYDWKNAEFHDAAWVIENIYKIPVLSMTYFTFDKFD